MKEKGFLRFLVLLVVVKRSIKRGYFLGTNFWNDVKYAMCNSIIKFNERE
ncbi:MAG: hypothetical protein JWQ09_4142 [Segetibacter sp.]|nr:hypothetical protein [Segetibacter sp.]